MAVYITLGFLLKLEAISYLLIGIPLTLIFQLFIVEQPLYKLWLRDAEKFHLNKLGWTITLCFLVFPIYKTIEMTFHNKLTLLNLGYYLAAILGAFGAGYCYSNFTKKTIKDFFTLLRNNCSSQNVFLFFPFHNRQP